MDEIARLTPGFANVSYDMLDKRGSVQWPCNDKAPEESPIMTSIASCAARASSSSPNISRPTRRPGRASRYYEKFSRQSRRIASVEAAE
jgi:predicted molibdopterin-dependent oxidoreductase YjgC